MRLLPTAPGSLQSAGTGGSLGRRHGRATGNLSDDELATSIAISPDGTGLAIGYDDKKARIWDAATGELRATLTGHQGKRYPQSIALDGTWLATASNDETARTGDAATGQLCAILDHDEAAQAGDAATGQQPDPLMPAS